MPKANLTNTTLERLKPPKTGTVTYWDTNLKAFGVRISQGGTKSFIIMRGRKRQRSIIGHFPNISLKYAREQARHMLLKPIEAGATFKSAFEQFKSQHMTTYAPSTFKTYLRYYEQHCTHLMHRPLNSISIQDINTIIDQLKPSEANHTFRAIRTFLNWCKKRGMITSAPTDVLSQPFKEKTRDRVLTDSEIQSLWKNTDYNPFGTFVRLLLLTGGRRAEVATLTPEHITEKEIIFFDTKNGTDHHLPITNLIQIHLDKVTDNAPYLFPASRSEKPISGFAKMKKVLEKEMDIPHWTLHDLRRTTATHMAELQVQPHIIERVLNHSSGTISSLGKIYNRHSYFAEMKAALTLWHDKILTLTT